MAYLRCLIMRNKPRIRFKGFTEDWEQRKLESLFTKYEDKVNTPDSGYWRLGLRSHCKGTFHTYVDAGHELETKEMYRVKAGNFILNITFAWERALAVTDDEDQGKLVSHRFPQFKPNSDLAIDFFKYTLIDKRFKHHLELSSPGGAGRNKVLKVSDMLKYELLVPSIQEQNIISSFLNNVDHIITLHQRKLEKLKLAKKALLQKLFPKNGSQFPELRFKGFTEAWEQRKFADLFDYERPDAYIVKSDNYNDKFNMPVLTANKAFILGYTNEKNSYDKPSIIFDDFTLDRKYVDFPYMLKSSAIKILTSKRQHNLRFLFERLNATRFEVLGHARHYISVVQNTTTLCPSFEEEVCISNLLTKFDELLTLHQCKLDKLQEVKKGLLQKMFV